MEKKRHIIWSNVDLNLDDWKDDLLEWYDNGDEEVSEQDLYALMCQANNDYLDDERMNLNVRLNNPILVIGDFGLWNGRFSGYKEINSGMISECLYDEADYIEWYVDDLGDFRADAHHHDGTNHYLYRVWKDGTTDYQRENLKDKIYRGKATRADITRLTKRLGDEIANVYGWNIRKAKKGA